MNTKLESIISDAKKSWQAEQASGRIRIRVTHDTSSLARGADETIAATQARSSAKKLVADVGITGSWGFCWMEPCVTVRSAAGTHTILYGNITPDRVDDFVEAIAAGKDVPELALGVIEGNATADIPLLSEHKFMQGQVRRLMANIGSTDPENIDHYLANDGYAGFGKGPRHGTAKRSSKRCWIAASAAALARASRPAESGTSSAVPPPLRATSSATPTKATPAPG